MFRIIRRVLAALLTCWFVWTNIGVHTAPRIGAQEERDDLLRQLRYLERQVHSGLGEEMQKLFPEGSVFTYALYGLAWCGYAEGMAVDDSLRMHALAEARWALASIERKEVQGRFPVAAEPKFGAFYCGWRNYLLGSIITLDPSVDAEQGSFDAYSAELEKAYEASASPFLESYAGMAWPADNVVAIASLAVHDQQASENAPVIARWVEQVQARLDARGMVPHAWDPYHDKQLEHARGCSQALMNVFMPTIDAAFATQQFERFREHFFMERFGVPLVREYPKGVIGLGNVDSGPVIFGGGCAATIVGAGTCRKNRDIFHATEFDHTVEGFGLVTGRDDKRFIFGALPIADLFIAWTRSMSMDQTGGEPPGFRRFHLWSLLAVVLLWSPTWFGFLRRRVDRKTGPVAGSTAGPVS